MNYLVKRNETEYKTTKNITLLILHNYTMSLHI
jgi:hypothetical protein